MAERKMEVKSQTINLLCFAVILLVVIDFILMISPSARMESGSFHSGFPFWRGEDFERAYVDTPERRRAFHQRSINESDCTYVTGAPVGSMKLRVLFAQHGSGGTWLRYLIELTTGMYTGSQYRDSDDYMAGLRGEALDPFDRSVIITRSVRPNMTREFQERTYNQTVPEEAIILIRNPYHSILSAYYRAQYLENGTIDDRLFSTHEWIVFADFESKGWFFGPTCTCADIKPSLTVFYEDLVNDTEEQLERITAFLGVNTSEERMKCALSHSGRVFRKYERLDNMTRDPYTLGLKKKINTRINTLRTKLEEGGCGVVPNYEVPIPESPGNVTKSDNNTTGK